MEIWKDVIGWEGYYQVSNYGNVRSLPRLINSSRGRQRIHKGIMVKPCIENKRSYVIRLSRNNSDTTIKLHRLVAKHFIPNPENKRYINHIDGNPKNNHVSNLEWCTAHENMIHSYRVLGRRRPMQGVTGEKHQSSKPVYVTKLGGSNPVRFVSLRLACAATGVSNPCASNVCTGKRKATKGFVFQYADALSELNRIVLKK